MERLKTNQENIELYNAGYPGFPRNFTRDSIISGILMNDPVVIKNQLLFAAKKQGKKKDPLTGEEHGKIFHEFPGFYINNLSTEYNACDTTALFLIGHFYYEKITGDKRFKHEQKDNIIQAIDYIKSHLDDYVFYENPSKCDSDKFALKVTYWKDSEIPKRNEGNPVYPIAYFLAHVINLAGIRFSSEIIEDDKLKEELNLIAQNMKDRINRFYDNEKKAFYIAIDSNGPIEGVSSDILHALFYLRSEDISVEQQESIVRSASELETIVGYLTLSPKVNQEVNDSYHSKTVWPFEQAIINIGARKFNLPKIEEVSKRIMGYLDTDPEIFILENDAFRKAGCDPQLWTIAAKKYFKMNS